MLSVAPKKGPDGQLQLHASTVVINGKAVAFTGPSGSGKTSRVLALMLRGAALLADDITWLETTSHGLIAHCPPSISGQIEARGVGILKAVPALSTRLHLIVDLGTPELDRLPKRKTITLLGQTVPLFHTPEIAHFNDAIMHYMQHGWAD